MEFAFPNCFPNIDIKNALLKSCPWSDGKVTGAIDGCNGLTEALAEYWYSSDTEESTIVKIISD
jgi:hypothetical protein